MISGQAPWSHYRFQSHLPLIFKIALSDESPLIEENCNETLK